MPGYVPRCPVFEFRPRISHDSGTRLDAEAYGIQLPGGLAAEHVREPTFVSPERMVSLLRSERGGGNSLGVVHGLTRADFSLRFSDLDRQWRLLDVGCSSPAWVFQGGDIYLETSIDVFVLEGDRPRRNDAVSRQIFAIIMEHELEHVADEIDIVSRWMPSNAYRDRLVRRYLTDAQPLSERTFSHWFRTEHFEEWLKSGLWAPEHNRRQSEKDSPENYAALQDRIDRLRVQQVNRP